MKHCPNPPGYLYEENAKSFEREPAIPAATKCGESPSKYAPSIMALCKRSAVVRLE